MAYSWRKVMPALADAGYYVIAPDLPWYCRTDGWNVKYDDDLTPFRTLNLVRDILGLVSAIGYRSVSAVVGHDFGAPLAAWCSIVRPDVFHSLVLMSGPFGGTPSLPFNTANAPQSSAASSPVKDSIYEDLARLSPPRKHYQRYYATREANDNLWHAPQGVHAFLRAYYYMKSADWPGNDPHPLESWSAAELAKIPRYYIMDLNKGMAETVAAVMPTPAQIAACKWLTEDEFNVYSRDIPGRVFKVDLTAIAWGRMRGTPPNCERFPVEPSTCRRCSSPARATGIRIRDRAHFKPCKPRFACSSAEFIFWKAPATGYSKSNRKQ